MLTNTKIKNKEELRKLAKKKRNELASNGQLSLKSEIIVKKIIKTSDFVNAKHIGLYYPIKNEINLLKLLEIKNKFFYFPRCVGNNLEFSLVESLADFSLGSYNIMEPKNSDKVEPQILDLIYIPSLMANRKNYRLGYGKGYYDRFFSNNKIKAKKILVLCSALISDDFVEDSTDYRCDFIMDEF